MAWIFLACFPKPKRVKEKAETTADNVDNPGLNDRKLWSAK